MAERATVCFSKSAHLGTVTYRGVPMRKRLSQNTHDLISALMMMFPVLAIGEIFRPSDNKRWVNWDIRALIAAVLMIIPAMIGLAMADFDMSARSVEIRKFKNPEHLETLISAFHFDLAPNETLYVENFRRGMLQADPELGNIAIEGIISVDDFISRYKSDIIEVDVVEYPNLVENRLGAFRACLVDLQIDGYYRELIFYQAKKGITARLDVEEHAWREIVDVGSILFGNYPSLYRHPFFLVPVAIQAGLVIFVVVRVIRRIIHKIRNKKGLNEGV